MRVSILGAPLICDFASVSIWALIGPSLTRYVWDAIMCVREICQFVGDNETDVYYQAHSHMETENNYYKSIHYAYQGLGVRFYLAVYDRIITKQNRYKAWIPEDEIVLLFKQVLSEPEWWLGLTSNHFKPGTP
jgi:hypothetical protein